MCGICGFVSEKSISLSNLEAMNNTMLHRGPDDHGEELYSFLQGREIGLAQRRLSIIDLSEKGHQPFHSNDDTVVVVFNGEIYNFLQLKEKLHNYHFKSNCDTEILVAAYQEWGMEFLKYIDGMFAVALFDRTEHILILARDRMGKKPLYYSFENRDFIFGSTLSAVTAFPGFHKRIERDAIARYLYNRYIASDQCIFQGVNKVSPGTAVIFDGETCKIVTYWNLVETYYENKDCCFESFEQSKEELKDALIQSVQKRMIADVPLGSFLSGGYDSSLVTAIAQSLSDHSMKTFSIGFENPEYDEAPYAEAIAKHLGTNHTNHYVTEQEMLRLVDSIPRYYDEPFADSSQIPSMLVAEIARQQVTVVLTGDGGDELFCGYNMYDKLYLAQKLEPIAGILRKLIRSDGSLMNRIPFSIRAVLLNDREFAKTQFGRSSYEQSIALMLGCHEDVIPYDETVIPESNWQIRRMLLDSITYLPENNLCKVDRATMKYSLEARNPLLDVAVFELACKIPHKYKYHRKNKKYILKELAYDYIPRELLDRPKKGFAVPIDQWLRGPLKTELIALTSEEYLKKQDIFSAQFTNQYVQSYIEQGDGGPFTGQNPSNIVWPLYVFQKWYHYYMES